MKQEKLESKALELFQRQEFDIEEIVETEFRASNGETEIPLKVLSSEKYEVKEALGKIEDGEKIFVDKDLEELKEKVENDVSVLEEVTEEEFNIPSYERIGDIVVISELDEISEEEAIEAVLEHNPGIDSILLKEKSLSGEFRIGGYRILYGDVTETVHREHGIRLKVDPTKMFFSEREGTERKRIFDSLDKDDEVLVMFAGAAPFPVTIARNSQASRIVGVEKNPEAVDFGRENIEMNSIEDKVKMIQGDVAEVCPELGEFDHVLMPSPTNALEFIEEALKCTDDGGRLVVYNVSEKDNLYKPVVEIVEKHASYLDLDVEVLEKRIVSDFSPAKRKVAVEFRVKE